MSYKDELKDILLLAAGFFCIVVATLAAFGIGLAITLWAVRMALG